MQTYQVGLLPCFVLRSMHKCVTVFLGHLDMEGQGQVEVWTSVSEPGLLSLREDLLHPEPTPSRSYYVGQGECCVTSMLGECIHVKVDDVLEQRDGEPTGRVAQVWGVFSLAGIARLLEHLQAAPDNQLNLQALVDHKRATPYGWVVIHRDGNVRRQFPQGGEETPFREVRLEHAASMEVWPRDGAVGLPIYSLDSGGFSETRGTAGPVNKLPLPVPAAPFQFRYYRRVTVTFAVEHGTGQPLPPRIVQVIGWRLGGLVCELGVEEDGSWTIYRRGRVREGTADEVVPMMEEEFASALAEEEREHGG